MIHIKTPYMHLLLFSVGQYSDTVGTVFTIKLYSQGNASQLVLNPASY